MSLLNNEAIKSVLLEEDIMSKYGTVQEIWNSFISGIDRTIKTPLNTILNSMESGIIDHLYLSDDKCKDAISILHNVTSDMEKSHISNNNNLYNFAKCLDRELSDYNSVLINNEGKGNIKSNIDSLFDPSSEDETKILYSLLKNGLTDPNEVQGLLDIQNLEIMTTANALISRCSRGESPLTKRCSAHKASPLLLEDFGTDVSGILDCAKTFINEDYNQFPTDYPQISKMIFPREDFDTQVLYSQDNYVPNLANYGILSSTLKYLEDSDNVDADTSIYMIVELINYLKNIYEQFNNEICLILYMAGLMALANKAYESDGFDEVSLIYFIKKELANAFLMYDKVDKKASINEPMLRIPSGISDFISCANGSNCRSMGSDECSDMLSDILSSVDEIHETLNYYGLDTDKQVGDEFLESVATSDSKTRSSNNTYLSKVEEIADSIHRELNQTLLDGVFENSAKQIALEIALLDSVRESQVENSIPLQIIGRDVSTYLEFVEKNTSHDINGHLTSARAEIANLLNTL